MVLSVPIWTHAQSWLSGESIMLKNQNLVVDNYAQKIRAIDKKKIIGISKRQAGDYLFTALFDGNSVVYESFLNNSNLEVADFRILKDWVYFCGRERLSSGNFSGIIGRFALSDFLDDGNFYYETTSITGAENLTNLVVYNTDDAPNVTRIVAIGDSASQGCMVCLDDKNNPNFEYSVLVSPVMIGLKEVFHDITFDEKYVMLLSQNYPQNRFSLRYAYKDYPELLSTHQQVEYYFPNHSFICTFDKREYPLHLTLLPNNLLAVSTTAADMQGNFFTMINFINVGNLTAAPTNQVVYHADKMIKTLEMEYSAESDSLLLLESSNMFGGGWNDAVSFVNPWMQPPYTSNTKYLPNLERMNYLCVVPNYGYAAVGSSPLNSDQLYWIKKVNNNQYACDKYMPISISTTTQGSASSFVPLNLNASAVPCQWNGNNAVNNSTQINIECQN